MKTQSITLKRPTKALSIATSLPIAILALHAPALAQPEQPSRIELMPSSTDETMLVREGAFLSEMQGELRRTQVGWVMDFAPDAASGRRVASMILQGGMTLTAMEQIIAAHDESIRFVISGQVFVFHNRNYLLPTRFAINSELDPSRPQQAPEPERDQSDQPTGLPGIDETDDEPSVDDLLNEVDPESFDSADMPIAVTTGGTASLLREGQMIAQVRGRVLPGAGGDLIFTPDTDTGPDAAEGEIPPLRLMPCLNVERLEKLRLEWGDQLIVSMSGRIFVDAGRPVLLPTMYIVELERSGNLSLGQ